MAENKIIPKHWRVNKFEDLLDYIQPTPYIVESTEYSEDYKTPVLTAGKSFVLGKTNEVNGIFNSLPVIIFDDFTTANKFVNFSFKVKSSAMKILKAKSETVNIKFVYYYMQTIRVTIDTHKRHWISVFSKLPIPSPTFVEQQAIVSKIEELLSDLENGKQQLQTAQQQLKVYRQSLLKWAFEGKLTRLNHDSSDLHDEHDLNMAAESQIEYIKNQESYNLPKGWKWVKLGDVCHNVEYGSATKSKKVGKVPVLRMGNIQNGRFEWEDLVFTDDDVEIEKYLLRKNDVLFNRTNSAKLVGKTAIYKGERPAIFAGYLIRINRIESMVDATYLTYYLNTHFAKRYGNSVRSFGVNQSNINGTKLKTYPIPLCPLEEQQLIVDKLENKLTICDKIEETISHSLQQAETLWQSILKKD